MVTARIRHRGMVACHVFYSHVLYITAGHTASLEHDGSTIREARI
jgi:hypothetical protein